MVWAAKAAPAADSEGSEMPRPAASALISIFQPLPTCATPPMTLSSGMKTSRPQVGPFWNIWQGRQVPAADLDARQVGRHQRDRDADLVALADEMIGIVELEGEPDHGRDRAERDVALVPVEPDAERPRGLASVPRQTTPESVIAAASEPASGLVSPKQGISLASASRGSQ